MRYRGHKYGKRLKTGFEVPRNAFKDKDGDGVANITDCKPNDPKRQGFLHDAVADYAAKRKGIVGRTVRAYRAYKAKEPEREKEKHERRVTRTEQATTRLAKRGALLAEREKMAKIRHEQRMRDVRLQQAKIQTQKMRPQAPRMSAPLGGLGGGMFGSPQPAPVAAAPKKRKVRRKRKKKSKK